MRVILMLIMIISIASCGKNPAKVVRSPNDTLKTIGVFVTQDSQRVVDFIYQVSFDTIIVDTNTMKAISHRDTSYYVPRFFPKIDSVGKPLKDSSGKILGHIEYLATTKSRIVWSANKNIDSLLKEKK